MGKNQRTGHISEAISLTDFILGTKVQPNKAHSMTQVPMTLTNRSRSKVKVKCFQKWVKNQRIGHISEAISPTDFILATKIQPITGHPMIQVPITLTVGQRSKLVFPQNGLNTKQLAIFWMLFQPQTSSYLLFISIITAFCDSFGRGPFVFYS